MFAFSIDFSLFKSISKCKYANIEGDDNFNEILKCIHWKNNERGCLNCKQNIKQIFLIKIIEKIY